jgi:hypothetical protein
VPVRAERIEPVHRRVLVGVWQQMAVGVDGGLDRRMPEPAAHLEHRHAGSQQVAREGVPQVVEGVVAGHDLGLLEQPVEARREAPLVLEQGAPLLLERRKQHLGASQARAQPEEGSDVEGEVRPLEEPQKPGPLLPRVEVGPSALVP